MRRLTYLLPFLILLLLVVSGCTTTGKKKGTPEEQAEAARPFYMTFLEFEKYRTDQNEMGELEYSPGKFVYVKPIPLLSSRNIVKIEPYSVTGGMGLRCFLDREGTTIWTQMSGTYRGEVVALMLDSQFRTFIKIPQFSNGDSFELSGPFKDDEAARIAAEAKSNYGNDRYRNSKKKQVNK